MFKCILPESCIQFLYEELLVFCFIHKLRLMSFIKCELTQGQEQSLFSVISYNHLVECALFARATQLLLKAAVNISNMHRCL